MYHIRLDQDGINYYRERRVSSQSAVLAQSVDVLGSSPLSVVSPDAVLQEINSKRERPGLTGVLIGVGFFPAVLGTVLLRQESIGVACLCYVAAFVCFGAIPWARWRDRRAATTNLIYSADGLGEHMQEGVRRLFQVFASTHASWCIDTKNYHGDWKRNGGAGTSVGRRRVWAGLSVPHGVRTNAKVGCVEVDSRRYYFFPDRILAYLPHKVESVPYNDLNVSATSTRFVESDAVPRDARVVDHTWLFVNKDGGPDRRFKNNRQFPVALYGELSLKGGQPLNLTIQTSNAETAEAAGAILGLMGRASAEMKTRPAPASPPFPPASCEFGEDISPLAGLADELDRLRSTFQVPRLPEWAQPLAWGLAFALPIVLIIAFLFRAPTPPASSQSQSSPPSRTEEGPIAAGLVVTPTSSSPPVIHRTSAPSPSVATSLPIPVRQSRDEEQTTSAAEAPQSYFSSDVPPRAPPSSSYSPPRETSSYSGGGMVNVRGYYRKNGTYVQPHTRRAPRRR